MGARYRITLSLIAAAAIAGCGEETSTPEERGERAVSACQSHGGVVAFEDDVAICRDQTVFEVEE